MKTNYTISAAALGIALCIGIIGGIAGLTTVEPGFVTLKVKMLGENRGIEKDTLNTGTHWVNPITYDTPEYDGRFRQYPMAKTSAETKDGQPIVLDLSFEIGLIDAMVPSIHESVGVNWYKQVVYPRARTAVRNATSAQLSDDIYTAEGRGLIRASVDTELADLLPRGYNITTNVRNLKFVDEDFISLLEDKAKAGQQEEIQSRLAMAAIQEAIKVENIAEGNKKKRIKAAEADKQEQILAGEGYRLRKEEEAKGSLAIYEAKAEGTRLQVKAYGSGETYASVKWAESIGPKFQVFGVPTGAEGTTTIMDLAGKLSGMNRIQK
jgi:regulator of protease activity HflC (stomatin/prohibitin superfamily)